MQRDDVQSSIRISPPLSRTSPSSLSPTSNGSPLLALSNSHIEAVIQMATASAPEGPVPGRDTRTQLFVGNLPYRVRWQDLKDLFRKAGTILRADVSLGPDNRSRGYGTVLFATREDAGRAVEMFNGYNWQTRILEVRLDRSPPSDLDLSTHSSHLNPSAGPSSASPFPGYGGPSSSDRIPFTSNLDDFPLQFPDSRSRTLSTGMTRNLFVGNLPFHCQWQDLKDLFRQAGTIIRADVALGPDGRSRGFGTVSFANDTDAERAVNIFNGYDYNGRILKVHYDKFAQAQTLMSQAQSPLLRLASPNLAQPPSLSSRFDSSTVNANMGSHTLIPMPAPLSALERELSLSRHRTPSPFHRPANTASLYRDVYPVSDLLDNDVTGIQSGASNAPLSSTARALLSRNEAPQFTPSPQPKPFGEVDPSASPNPVVGSFTHTHLPPSSTGLPSSLSLSSAENGISSILAARKSGPPPVPLSTKPSLTSVTANANLLGSKNDETSIPSLKPSLTLSSSLPTLGSLTSTSPKTSPVASAKPAPQSTSSEPATASTSTPATAPAPIVNTASEPVKRAKTLSRSRQNSSHPHPHPGPITLPSPSLPSFPPVPGGIPVSPFQGLPPITPSMPTFTFVPQNPTPPLNPHFLSPGVGLTPFSPPAPMSPGSYYHPNHRYHPMPWNPAPGAPIHHAHPHSPIYAMHGHSPLHSPSAAGYFASQSGIISGPAGPPADYFSVPPPMPADGYFPPVYPSADTANSNDLGPGSNTDSAAANSRPADRPSSSDDSIPTRSGHSLSEDGESQRRSRKSSDASSWHHSHENLHSMAEELGRISIGPGELNKLQAGNSEAEQRIEQASVPPSGPQRTHSDESKLPTTSSLGIASRSEANDEHPDSGAENAISSLSVHTPGERRASWTPVTTKTVFRRELMNSTTGSAS